MKIYWEHITVEEVPNRIRRPGEFFTRLVGVNVSSAGNCEPIYIPLLRVHRQAGQLLIEINTDRPLAYITIQVRPPYISVFRFQWETLDQDN
jgi:hypothetical protein